MLLNSTKVLSLGAGVQSTVMALMCAKHEISPVDHMIFADTQWEPKDVYIHLDWLEGEITRLTNGQTQMHRVTAGDIKADHLNGLNSTGQRFASMPLFCDGGIVAGYWKSGGMGRRQCTNEYKIQPIRKKIRSLLGVEKGKRVPKGINVIQLMGISTDEATRMKPSRDKWCENIYPLIEIGMSRQHCHEWFAQHYPGRTLCKSACIGCPFHNDALWRDMKLYDPDSFAEAVAFDKAIRHNGLGGKQQYLHRSCVPLDEVDFRNIEDMGQMNFFNNECAGMCGI